MEAILLINSANGKYIPQNLGELAQKNNWNISKDDLEILQYTDNEWYWDTYNDILNSLIVEVDGQKYTLLHSEDVWLIPYDWTSEQIDEFMI